MTFDLLCQLCCLLVVKRKIDGVQEVFTLH